MYQEQFEIFILDDNNSNLDKGSEICSAPLKALKLINKLKDKIEELESLKGE